MPSGRMRQDARGGGGGREERDEGIRGARAGAGQGVPRKIVCGGFLKNDKDREFLSSSHPNKFYMKVLYVKYLNACTVYDA